MATENRDRLMTAQLTRGSDVIITPRGVLDSVSYLLMRDSVIKAAVDGPRSVIIDVNGLTVPSSSAWVVFSSARWHIHQWLDLPTVLVCSAAETRETIRRVGVTRYLPVFDHEEAAIAAVDAGDFPHRRRARITFAGAVDDAAWARRFATRTMALWTMSDYAPVVSTAAGLLVENAAVHADGAISLRLESCEDVVTVAAADRSTDLAVRRERREQAVPSGLDVVAALCRRWGNSPTLDGKTVWACVGPENCLTDIAGLI